MTTNRDLHRRFNQGRVFFLSGYVPFRLLKAAQHRDIDEAIQFGINLSAALILVGTILMLAALSRRIGRLRAARDVRRAYEASVEPGDGSRGLGGGGR